MFGFFALIQCTYLQSGGTLVTLSTSSFIFSLPFTATTTAGNLDRIERLLQQQEERNKEQESEIYNLKRTLDSAIKDIELLCKLATPSRPPSHPHVTRTIGTSTISNTKTTATSITPPFKVPRPINFSKNVATSPISSLKICDCCDKVINLK